MSINCHDAVGRRPKASPKQLIGLLRLRLGTLAACVGRIEGIDQRLHKLDIRLPRSMMPPLPAANELRNARDKLLDKLWEWPEQKRVSDEFDPPQHSRPNRSGRRRRTHRGNGRAVATVGASDV
jgi:hypothetical protein